MSTNNDDFKIPGLFDVKDRVCLVTGGGSGIGLMCVQALAVNGAKVYIVGRTMEKLEQVVKSHGQNIAGQIIPIQGDITSKQDIERLAKEIESKEKCICVLINNAGISGDNQKAEGSTGAEWKKNLFEDKTSTFEMWTDVYNTNVASMFFVSTAFLPLVEAATKHHKGYSGTIINITSISGLTNSSQNQFAYNSSKGAAIHLTKMLASEICNSGVKVRINSIAPGVFPSEMTSDGSDKDQKSQTDYTKFQPNLPAQRAGSDRDMAQTVLFMVTNQYLNGQTVAVDGGFLLATGT